MTWGLKSPKSRAWENDPGEWDDNRGCVSFWGKQEQPKASQKSRLANQRICSGNWELALTSYADCISVQLNEKPGEASCSFLR